MTNGGPTTLKGVIEQANIADKNVDIFSKEDLEVFNSLIFDEASFDILLQGFEDQETIKEMKKVPGLEETIKVYVETQKKLNTLTETFNTEYKDLTKNHDLYEVCVLGAILQKETIGEITDYKTLAKAYYESITVASTAIDKNIETLPAANYGGTFETASVDIDIKNISNDIDNTNIEMVMEQKDGKKITEVTGIVSAGADIRKMDINKAKNKHTKKIKELKEIGNTFTDDHNKQEIQKIISELENETKIQGISNNDANQYGNCYLIAARLAEGFIKILTSVPRKPDPKLDLKIDRDKCKIGTETNNNGNIKDDRFIGIYATATREDLASGEQAQTYEKTSSEIQATATTATSTTTSPTTTSPTTTSPTNTATNTARGGGNNSKDKGSGPHTQINIPQEDINVSSNTPQGNINVSSNTPVEHVETPEIIALKKAISEHITIDGKNISRERDIANNIIYNNGIYTLSIAGYTGLQFEHNIEKKELSLKTNDGGIRKGLFLYNTQAQTINTENKNKINIVPTFNATKTIEALNKQMETNDKDENKQGDYKITTINGDTIHIEYGVNFVQNRTNNSKEQVKDTRTIQVDPQNKLILPDSQGEGQISQWKKVEGSKTNNTDFALQEGYKIESGAKIYYYTQTKVNQQGVPELIIINNIQKNEKNAFESIYTEHKELTNPEFKEITEDFLTNKIERIFVGTLNEKHREDFQNNRKIEKGNKKNEYIFQITFNKNDGKQQEVRIPFRTEVTGENTRTYIFPPIQPKGDIHVNNIVYDIHFPIGINNIPNIRMIENQEKTLKLAEENTSKTILSDIFGGERVDRGNDGKKYDVTSPALSLSPIEFNGKGGFKRTILFGEKKDINKNILLPGEERGTVYYDQDHKIIYVKIITDNKEIEIDFINPENTKVRMENVLEDESGVNKGVLLIPTIKEYNGKASIEFKFETPDQKTERQNNRQTKELYSERIREEKELIFTGLKQLSTTLTGDNMFMLPSLKNTDETSYKATKLVGPDGRGLYRWNIAKAYQKGNKQYLEQNIYCKVDGKSLVLCDSDGKQIEYTYIIDYKNNSNYKLEIDKKDPSKFSVTKLDKVDLQKVANLTTESFIRNNGKVNLNLENKNIELLYSNLTNSYTFANNKREMCTIVLDENKELDKNALEAGANKKPQIVEIGQPGFGSYKKYFAGNGRENLGISEQEYEEAFKKIYETKANKDSNKDIIQVKLWSSSDNRYYYEYMAIEGKKGNKFSLTKLKGMEEAKAEMEKRLDNLVLLDKIQPSTKGDQLRGVKINHKNTPNRIAYLKDGTTPINITITDTNGNTTAPMQITLHENKNKRKLENNTDIQLGTQNISCYLEFKSDLPFLKIEIIEQTKE